MIHRHALVLTGFGFVAGVLLTMFMTQGWPGLPQAAAQAAKAETPRYQVSSWAYPGFARQNFTENPEYGAYLLDTHTGEVWVVKKDSSPRSVGQVKKP